MDGSYVIRHSNSFWRTGLVVFLLLALAACSRPEPLVKTTKDIKPGHSIIIAKTYVHHLGSTRKSEMAANFVRFDPPTPKQWTQYSTGPDRFETHDGLPGKYHFYGFQYPGGYYLYEPHNPRYEFTVGQGEAVYIGDIVQLARGGRFRIRIDNNSDAARAYFEKNFANSGLTFRTRLLRRIRKIEPVLPK